MDAIIISGLPGAGSTSIAKLLAARLQVRHFSAGQLYKDIANGSAKNQTFFPLFKKLLAQHNIVLPQLDNKNDTEGCEKFWQTPLGKDRRLHQAIDDLLRLLAKKGDIVIDAKLGIRMISTGHKVWVTADENVRVARTAKKDGLDLASARTALEKRHEHEVEEWKRMYGFDYTEQEFDKGIIVVDSTSLSVEEIVKQVRDEIGI